MYSIVHPSGTPLVPTTSHVAPAFFTNVPVDETPDNIFEAYVDVGGVIHIHLI